MLDTARSMFAQAIKAYITRDVELAKAVCMDDNIIDDNFSTVVMELCNIIAEREPPSGRRWTFFSLQNTSNASATIPPTSPSG